MDNKDISPVNDPVVDNLEKTTSKDGDKAGVSYVNEFEVNEAQHLKDVEALEDRIQHDEATKEEYAINNSHDVAIKVLSLHDDPELPAFTFRTLFLGGGLACFGAVLAQLYYFKPQTINVSQSFLLIISYFLGLGMSKLLPSRGIFKWINPGPFNIKEHAAIIIMCSTAAGSAVAIQVISVQDLFYNNKMNGGVAIFTLIASQTLGYGYAGLLQSSCVRPSICLWPAQISVANTFQALHFDGGLSTKRLRFFWAVFTFMFFYELLPQYIFPLLTAVSIICLINHTNPVLRNVFGGGSNNEGIGLLEWSFEWNYIGSSCLTTPLMTQLNIDMGIFLTYILMTGVYYGNVWNGLNFPFMSQAIFDSDGNEYNQTLILTDNVFDPVKYETVGPAWFSATNALFLIVDNLSIGAALVHTALYYHGDLKPLFRMLKPNFSNIKSRFNQGWKHALFGEEDTTDGEFEPDEHYQVLRKYKPVPQWWFTLTLIGAFAMAMATNYAGDSKLPWWALIIILLISFIFCTIYSFLAGTLGFVQFVSGGTGLFQMLAAYMVPGNPVANMYAAMYGNNPQVQCIAMLGDLKLGTYIKIPPRITFFCQMLGTVIGCILNYVIMLSVIDAQRPALLSISGTRLWSGQNAQSYNSNAISWGALGPEMFGRGKPYVMVPAALGIGCALPIPFYLAYRFRPNWGFQNINTAIIMQYSAYMSVGVNSSVLPAAVIGIFSQWFVRRKYPRAFTKYNYLLAGAMDGGTQIISFILNFAVFGAAGTAYNFPVWWGNNDVYSTDRCLAPDN